AEVFLRIDATASATVEQGVNDGAPPTGPRIADEKPAAPSDRRRSNVVFDEVIIDLEASIAKVTHHRRVFVKKVVDRLAQGALGQETGFGAQGLPSPFERQPNHGYLLQSHRLALGWTATSDFVFDFVEEADLSDE